MPHATVPVIDRQPALCHPAVRSRPDCQIISRSAAMREILDAVRRIASVDVPVLIQGEMGVGKQTIAREIHRQSPHAAGPFVHIVCGSLRESDLEEKLFGESPDWLRRGVSPAASALEAGQCGTLFLDGVAQLPLWAQIKLLDALQCRRSQHQNNGADVPPPARLIASSTCDLESAVVENRFCSGLYYQLNAARIEVPLLRHRPEDILALADHFLAAVAEKLAPPRSQLPWRFSLEARQALLRCDWPGNVVQLAAVVGHAVLLADGPEIGSACVAGLQGRAPHRADSETIAVPLAGGLKEMELALINEVLRRCRGNKAAAARTLKLHRRTLYRLLEE